MSKSQRAPSESSDARPQKTRLRYRVRCPDCGFSQTRRNRGDAYSLQNNGCPRCDRGLGVSKVRPAAGWTDDEQDSDELPSPTYPTCGEPTDDGEPCEQPEGWGTPHDEGPCRFHRDDEPEVRTDGGEELTDPRRAALETIDSLEEDHGAPLGQVVEELAQEFGVHDACEQLATLTREAKVYAPTDTTLRPILDVDRGRGVETDGGRSPAMLEAELEALKRKNERLMELARGGQRLQAELPSIIEEVAEATDSGLACDYCDGTDEHEKHSVCPNCESSGFDAQGAFTVGSVQMYRLRCWECGHRFAVEIDPEGSA